MSSLTKQRIAELKKAIHSQVLSASTEQELLTLKTKYLGKNGELTSLVKEIPSLKVEERKEFGQVLNIAKEEVETIFNQRVGELKEAELLSKLKQEKLDVTLPVDVPFPISQVGALHPLTAVQKELEDVFVSLGFTVVDGPEADDEYHNFIALNVPSTHPARDMQDTFWIDEKTVMRTHTSTMQVRSLEKMTPPLRIVAPGRCFRCERSDASHDHTFYQVEGMMVDKHVTVDHMLYYMKKLLTSILKFEPKIRLRPGYFPFVEPGFELEVWFNGRWMEMVGCGLVHKNMFEIIGLDSSQWQGFAFGLGLTRLVMSRYQIDDIRHLLSSDIRFLKQFR